jgi:hypothetical protein
MISLGEQMLHDDIARTGHSPNWKRRVRIESVIEAVAIVLVGWLILQVWP